MNGLELDLHGCDLRNGNFKESRFGHATFSAANLQDCSFQQAMLWGADLSGASAQSSKWHDSDLSSARLQKANFSGVFCIDAAFAVFLPPGAFGRERGWWKQISAQVSINSLTSVKPTCTRQT
ncbi:pentapeptide repeat-containing protein [Synechococcus sp. KORDI-52]|uniref:pentapeptide repeat-containing protein n=1 Tax=Synechococcus sp. KORDI-52 TaxID=585425 RepID=UPI0020A65DE1|nr:pentapeptide repeat-containing protein [Synechococcus sp. KORDI-52]